MTIQDEIKRLEQRKEIIEYSRKITTSIINKWMFEDEIEEINKKLQTLSSSLKPEKA